MDITYHVILIMVSLRFPLLKVLLHLDFRLDFNMFKSILHLFGEHPLGLSLYLGVGKYLA